MRENVSAYDNDKPRLGVHKEKLGHALSLNECSHSTCVVR
jgi:hypothetical protein